jgi:molybdate transport system substrate-binding protein
MPAEISILSAGAVKPGLIKVIDSFGSETGHKVKVSFATAPTILKLIGEDATIDIVIAPAAALDELLKTRKCAAGERVTVGRIGVGVMVRDGAPLPNITTVEEFKQSLLSAESLVYNQASTGIYLERLFDRLGIAAELNRKSTRYPDFAAVLDHISKGKGREIGLGATTVILENSAKGIRFAGPLPAEIQNYTVYAAVAVDDSAVSEAAQQFVRHLTTASAKSQLRAAGIE